MTTSGLGFHEILCTMTKSELEFHEVLYSDKSEKIDGIQQFDNCKKALQNVTLLSFPDPKLPLGLFMDASATAVGLLFNNFTKEIGNPFHSFQKK
ncbi:hypothetical protein RUM44_002317 [Polyplax serrata]|uniref:Reverse transcriptase/retrotransposon-derived protein RNase H-like domain-containing protein n=1 Tax=Polyplax serrata TaxID=468196 RepID=A0ABR1AMI8_POLSC